jgi:BioD-like phosphotransacetylase family protein
MKWSFQLPEPEVPYSKRHLIIGSIDPYSGKSTVVLALAHALLQSGVDLAYGKPIGTCSEALEGKACSMDGDVQFLTKTLNIPNDRIYPTLVMAEPSSLENRLSHRDTQDYVADFKAAIHQSQSADADLVLLEGPGTLDEGCIYGLSLTEMATIADAGIILVIRLKSYLPLDSLIAAKQRLGDRLVGVFLNDIHSHQMDLVQQVICPYLEKQSIPVLGILPHSEILKSVSVGELVHRLEAQVLCCPDRMDLMVENLFIGAMNVNSALEYFRRGRNMAIVTGSDRTDLQLAAMETATQCLVLTGHTLPLPTIITRAEELEIPILSVDLDTLSAVEIIENALGQVRLHEGIKLDYVFEMSKTALKLDRLMGLIR